MSLYESLLRVNADGTMEQIMLSGGSVTQDMLAGLLHTDVTERLRVSRYPEQIAAGDSVLCFYLDARGGDRSLPANTLGTCLYHTGCPICGDLIFVLCAQDHHSDAVSGFDPEQYAQLLAWLHTEFSAFLHDEIEFRKDDIE